MAYGLVIGQCNNYLRSRFKGQEKWETTLNEWDLLGILQSMKSLLHKYDEDTEYHLVAYHTLICRFMLFRQGEYSNSEYKQRFKGKMRCCNHTTGESYSRISQELRRERSRYWD